MTNQHDKQPTLLERLDAIQIPPPESNPFAKPIPNRQPTPPEIRQKSIVVNTPPSRTGFFHNAAHVASTCLTLLVAAEMVGYSVMEHQRQNIRIPLKAEAAQQIRALTQTYFARGTTRWACGFAKGIIRKSLDAKFHPSIDVGCKLLRDLGRTGSQEFLRTLDASLADNILTGTEISRLQAIVHRQRASISCPDLETALRPLPETPAATLGRNLARGVSGCPTPSPLQ